MKTNLLGSKEAERRHHVYLASFNHLSRQPEQDMRKRHKGRPAGTI